jgi:tetratricopeptide (TPR) repeat protein
VVPDRLESTLQRALEIRFPLDVFEKLSAPLYPVNPVNSTPAAMKLEAPTAPAVSVLGRDIAAAAFNRGLGCLLLLGLIVRLAFLLEHAKSPSWGVPTLDQVYYDTVAKMLLAGEDLHELHGFRPLLYPIFLAVWYKIGGVWGVDLALLVQHLLGVATGLMVAFLGARLFRHRLSGLLGGLLYVLAPVPLYFEGELLIEPSYVFLICVGLLLTVRAAEAQGMKSGWLWLLSGAWTVLTAQARANILVFLGVYPFFAVWRAWHTRNKAALSPLLGLLGGLLMALPWAWINMSQSDHFHLLPNAGGVALYLGNKRTADGMVPEQERRIQYGERYQDSVEVWAREEYEKAQRAQGRQPDTDPMAISHYWVGRTIDEIRAAPASWLRLMLKKCWLTLWNAEVPNNKAFAFLQQEYFWLRVLPVRWVVLLMLAPAGIWAAAKWGRRDDLFILLVYAGFYSAANVAFFICDRYRYPVWPVMAVLAGGGCLVTLELIRRRRIREIAFLVVGMGLMAVLSLHNWMGAKLPSYARDYLFRSIAWYDRGRFDQALGDINQSVELDPLDATAFQHRGNVLFALNRFEAAKASFEQALKLSPGDAATWNNLGATFEAMGRTDDALSAFRRAVECTTPSKNAFLSIACILIRAGRLDEAALVLDQVEKLKRNPDATILATRSVVERRRGQAQLAEALEQRARRMDPEAAAWALKRAGRGGNP